MTLTTQSYLEITDASGVKRDVALLGPRMIVGRTEDVELTLLSSMVSRRHAEFFIDPFDRWWIRDLGSRNGTFVNSKSIDEYLLQPNDLIAIEDFSLTYKTHGEIATRPRTAVATSLTLTDTTNDNVTRLDDWASPKIDASHLSVLTKFSSKILAANDEQQRLAHLCELLVNKTFHGNAALVFRLTLDNVFEAPEILCGPVWGKNWHGDQTPYISKTLIHSICENRSPIIASNVNSGGSVMALSLAGNIQELAAIACPIREHATCLDVLYVTFPGEYGTVDWLALASLAAEQFQQAEQAWYAKQRAQEQLVIERELERAQKIQSCLMPKKIAIPGMAVTIGFEPCRWVGGDYVDVLQGPNGQTYMVLADVCGKGMQAAIITASLHSMFHMNVKSGIEISELMERFNDYLFSILPSESFVTAIALMYDPATGHIISSNAGHPPAMIVNTKSKTHRLPYGINSPLGFMTSTFETCEYDLREGEMLCLFTDGLTETMNTQKEMLGIAGIAKILEDVYRQCHDRDINQAAKTLVETLNQFELGTVRNDDRTFLLARKEADI